MRILQLNSFVIDWFVNNFVLETTTTESDRSDFYSKLLNAVIDSNTPRLTAEQCGLIIFYLCIFDNFFDNLHRQMLPQCLRHTQDTKRLVGLEMGYKSYQDMLATQCKNPLIRSTFEKYKQQLAEQGLFGKVKIALN